MKANLFLAALAGLCGAGLLTLLIYILKAFGEKIDIPYLLGSRVVDIKDKSKVYIVGILLHLLAGAGWGILYVVLQTGLAITRNWPAGILWGFAHGIVVGVMMSTMTEKHPYVGEGKPIPSPGIMGRKWGNWVPVWILALHVIYGAFTMFLYHRWMMHGLTYIQ